MKSMIEAWGDEDVFMTQLVKLWSLEEIENMIAETSPVLWSEYCILNSIFLWSYFG